MPRGLTVLCAAKLHANQLERHLELFEHIEDVSRVIVVRNSPLPERLPKLENHAFRPGPRLVEAVRMMRDVRRLIATEKVDWVIGFNPVPWGSLAFSAARTRGVPTCLSLIGMDFIQIQKSWGRPFLEAVRRADAVTVTGDKMYEGLVRLEVEPSKIHVLPHSIDLARFRPSDEEKTYDIISVGQLITRKRMDVIIDAVAHLKAKNVHLKVGILGKGPLESELRARAAQQGVAASIDFLGYRDDVEALLGRARVFCLASEWEGVPFAMMEAMASGLVPVVTDVGTIGDWVSSGNNGQLIPVGDAVALASALALLFENDGAELERRRTQIIAERRKLGFLAGARVWKNVFGLE